MSGLVTCPNCGGTGEIRLPEPKAPDMPKLSKTINDNMTEFARLYGAEEKPKKIYTTCPDCRGFGRVRG